MGPYGEVGSFLGQKGLMLCSAMSVSHWSWATGGLLGIRLWMWVQGQESTSQPKKLFYIKEKRVGGCELVSH